LHKKSNIKGQRFGRLTTLKLVGKSKWGHYVWECQCDCGNIVNVISKSLNSGETKSCGCLRKYKSKINIKKLHINQQGKNNPSYNPNLTNEDRVNSRHIPGYKKWRQCVYERDNYTCQCCGDNKGGNLVAHHLESYNNNKDLRTTIGNGVTLCETCHKDFHHQYGYGDNTKEQFKCYIV